MALKGVSIVETGLREWDGVVALVEVEAVEEVGGGIFSLLIT